MNPADKTTRIGSAGKWMMNKLNSRTTKRRKRMDGEKRRVAEREEIKRERDRPRTLAPTAEVTDGD